MFILCGCCFCSGKYYICIALKWPRSLMDRASDYGSEGCRFESYRGHTIWKTVIDIQSVMVFFYVVLDTHGCLDYTNLKKRNTLSSIKLKNYHFMNFPELKPCPV